jgi:hypothetical protein
MVAIGSILWSAIVGLESIEQFKETVQGESEPDTSRESMESRDDRDHRE